MTKRRNRFTLIELLVAIGLLSLIMMLLFQLFSSAQKLWIASEKTNNLYSNARVSMELMADILNTVQFSHGEKDDGSRNKEKDMIFSLDSKSTFTYGGKHYDSNSVIFVAKTARELPMANNPSRFISFRLGKFGTPAFENGEPSDEDKNTRGKLLMVVYSDKKGEDESESEFYKFFPVYTSYNGKRDSALTALKSKMDSLVTKFKNSTSASGENEHCQVIAENVVEFKLTAFSRSIDDGELKKEADVTDFPEPPYMIEIQITVLDPDSFKRWQQLSDNVPQGETQSPRTRYLEQNKHTFTRCVYIGNRWALEAK